MEVDEEVERGVETAEGVDGLPQHGGQVVVPPIVVEVLDEEGGDLHHQNWHQTDDEQDGSGDQHLGEGYLLGGELVLLHLQVPG